MTSDKPDLVATWRLQLDKGQRYKIDFEHGTTSGKRYIYVNNQIIYKKDWMFKLVGKEEFKINDTNIGRIEINPSSSFTYEYTLFINNKSFEKFKKEKSKTCTHWIVNLADAPGEAGAGEVKNAEAAEARSQSNLSVNWNHPGHKARITLEKTTMDIYINGHKIEAESMFGEDGVETHFVVNYSLISDPKSEIKLNDPTNKNCCIKNISSGDKREGMMHLLFIDDAQIPELA